jgi:hypothetical protein
MSRKKDDRHVCSHLRYLHLVYLRMKLCFIQFISFVPLLLSRRELVFWLRHAMFLYICLLFFSHYTISYVSDGQRRRPGDGRRS